MNLYIDNQKKHTDAQSQTNKLISHNIKHSLITHSSTMPSENYYNYYHPATENDVTFKLGCLWFAYKK